MKQSKCTILLYYANVVVNTHHESVMLYYLPYLQVCTLNWKERYMETIVLSTFLLLVKATVLSYVRLTNRTAVALYQTVLENSTTLKESVFQSIVLDRVSIVIGGISWFDWIGEWIPVLQLGGIAVRYQMRMAWLKKYSSILLLMLNELIQSYFKW